MEKLILLLFLLFCLNSNAYRSAAESKSHRIYTNTDSLSNNKQNNSYCRYIKNDSLVKLYKDIVFNNANCGVYDEVMTMQWKNEIIIYLDKSIPKNVRKNFKSFFRQINDLDNLTVGFTRNIEKANFLIENTSDDLLTRLGISNKSELYPYSHTYYSLLTDNNSKFYGGTLSINIEAIKDKTLLLPKLKQLFFICLGQFTIDKDVKPNSLLSYSYNNAHILSEEDKALLNLHYIKLHKKPLSCLSYGKFITQLKTSCTDE